MLGTFDSVESTETEFDFLNCSALRPNLRGVSSATSA